MKFVLTFGVLLFISFVGTHGATRILLIGGSQALKENIEAAFNPSEVASFLEGILRGDALIEGPIEVRLEDTYRNDPATSTSSRTLMSWYYWPNSRKDTDSLLDDGWDFIALIDDPYVASAFPEYSLEGVMQIVNAAARKRSEPLLLMTWPSGSSSFSSFEEMAYRVADGAGIRVVPAGVAWRSVNHVVSDPEIHPSPRGAYVAAATLYSTMFSRNASHSDFIPLGFSLTERDELARAAYHSVTNGETRRRILDRVRRPTHFASPPNKRRYLECADFNSSTEHGVWNGFSEALNQARIRSYRFTASYQTFPLIDRTIDFCQSRFHEISGPVQIVPNSSKWINYACFDIQDINGAVTMMQGIDRVIVPEGSAGASLLTDKLMDQGEFYIPLRVLWSRIKTAHPEIVMQPVDHHLAQPILEAVGSMMYTLLSGRCPIGIEPVDTASYDWQRWFCRRVGYETAWQHATLNSRVPGFEVLPSSSAATNFSRSAPEILSVRFLYPPASKVTVTVNCDIPNGIIATPAALTFSPENYNSAQLVTVVPGSSATSSLNIVFESHSQDLVFDGLKDVWEYSVASTFFPKLLIEESAGEVLLKLESAPAIDLRIFQSRDLRTWAPLAGGTVLTSNLLNHPPIRISNTNQAYFRLGYD